MDELDSLWDELESIDMVDARGGAQYRRVARAWKREQPTGKILLWLLRETHDAGPGKPIGKPALDRLVQHYRREGGRAE